MTDHEYRRLWWKVNGDRVKAIRRAKREAMTEEEKEERRAYARSWYAANKEKAIAANLSYIRRNREKIRARQRERYANNAAFREKTKEYNRDYYYRVVKPRRQAQKLANAGMKEGVNA